MQPFPPLGSLYAAGMARSLGHDVRVHDSMLAHALSEWSAALQVNDPDVVVIYEDNFNYLTKMCLLEMRAATMEMMRAANERGARVVVCSSDSADEPELYLRAGADVVLLGEGEETLEEVLGLFSSSSSKALQDIVGIAFIDEAGELLNTGRRAVIRKLDDLPLPAWDLIDLERYAEIWGRRHDHSAINLVTTRGCPYHCNWCAKPIWGQRYNARSPEHVLTEIEYLQSLTKVDYVWFMDDIFGLKPKWIERFAGLLESRNIRIRFKCLSRPDILLREGEIAALAQAGCDIVWLGAESGSQQILDAMEKGTTVEMIETASESLREHGVKVGLFIQFGYPGETRQDVKKTIQMIRKIMPEQLGISVSYPLPGTRFHERVKSELGQTRHWRDSEDLAMLFQGPFNTAYYRSLYRYVHSDLALRKDIRNRKSVRTALKIAYHALSRTVAALMMAINARMPHKGIDAIPSEMDLVEASTPSRQSTK
ncbi:MAG: B12-binding domain-containing radical SAM protein [Gammaproteobacteria bacterium]|nr:B12-binding domain-containing radical SAM protein [Gammaproteobacteria bacterium]